MPALRDWDIANVNIAATGDLITAANNTKGITIYGYAFFNGVATAQEVSIRTGTTTLLGPIDLPSSIGGGLVDRGGFDSPIVFIPAGTALNLLLGAATQVDGYINYYKGK